MPKRVSRLFPSPDSLGVPLAAGGGGSHEQIIQRMRPSWRRLRRWTVAGAIACAAWSAAEVGQAQIVRPAIGRFHADRIEIGGGLNLRNRYLQREALPRFEERQTHLGWEVRGETYVVTANTSRDDALRAAQAIEATWNETLELADYWTDRHRQQNFSVAAISVHIDQNPRRERQEGDLRFVNNQTHIYLNVADGEPDLPEQLGKLRASTVHAFWRRSEFDTQIPAWARSGLASYIADKQAERDSEAAPAATGDYGNVYDPYWQRGRIGQDRLAPREEDSGDGAIQVRYLMEGDDARHAPGFLAALRQCAAEQPATDAYGRRAATWQPLDAPGDDTPVDRYYARVEAGLGEWVSNPMVDQPQFELLAGPPSLHERQREMAFLLKLAHRMESGNWRGAVRPKVIGRDEERQRAANEATLSVPQLWRELTAGDAPLWATIDPHGQLLLSNETERLRAIFEPDSGTGYRSAERNGHAALVTWLDPRTRLIAWMEENPESPRQPLVRFEQLSEGQPTP